MLYVNLEVNRHTVAAFVDSGAQTTIVGFQTAQVCLPLPPLPLPPASPPSPLPLTCTFALALAPGLLVVAPVKVAKCMHKRNILLANRWIILCVRGPC